MNEERPSRDSMGFASVEKIEKARGPYRQDDDVPGCGGTRDWIQINRADASEYEKDLELFQASIEFVKAGGAR